MNSIIDSHTETYPQAVFPVVEVEVAACTSIPDGTIRAVALMIKPLVGTLLEALKECFIWRRVGLRLLMTVRSNESSQFSFLKVEWIASVRDS